MMDGWMLSFGLENLSLQFTPIIKLEPGYF